MSIAVQLSESVRVDKPCAVIPRRALLDALRRVTPSLDHDSSMPVLTNVHVALGLDGVTITATDLETWHSAHVAADVPMRGECLVSPRDLERFVRASKERAITLTVVSPNAVRLKLGPRRETELQAMPGDDFPARPERPNHGDRVASVSCREMTEVLSSVVPAASVDEWRPHLAGVHFESDDHALRVFATDGRRLHVCTLASFDLDRDGWRAQIQVRAAGAIRRVCDASARVGAQFSLNDSGLHVETDMDHVVAVPPKSKHEPVQWRAAIPTRAIPTAQFSAKGAVDELNALRRVVSTGGTTATLSFGGDRGNAFTVLRIARNGSVGESVLWDGEGWPSVEPTLSVELDTSELLDALKAARDADVSIRTNGSDGTVVLRAGLFSALLLPIQSKARESGPSNDNAATEDGEP